MSEKSGKFSRGKPSAFYTFFRVRQNVYIFAWNFYHFTAYISAQYTYVRVFIVCIKSILTCCCFANWLRKKRESNSHACVIRWTSFSHREKLQCDRSLFSNSNHFLATVPIRGIYTYTYISTFFYNFCSRRKIVKVDAEIYGNLHPS